MRKKAINMIEITLSVLLLTYFIYEGIYFWQTNKWNDALNKFNGEIYQIVDKGIINNVTGYLNASGGDCSDSTHYNNISAARVVDCNGWSQHYPYEGEKNNIGVDSYIVGLFKNYSSDNKGCKVYIDDKDTISFYVFVDCSNLQFRENTRSKQLFEENFSFYIKNSFSTIYQGLDREAIAIDNEIGGTNEDGMIRFLIKK